MTLSPARVPPHGQRTITITLSRFAPPVSDNINSLLARLDPETRGLLILV